MPKYFFNRSFLKGIFFAFIVFSSVAFSQEQPGFRIIQQTADRMEIEWNSPPLEWETINVQSQQFVVPRLGSLPLENNEGSPLLPVDAFLVENVDTQAKMTILDSAVVSGHVAAICPAPFWHYDSLRQVQTEEYQPDPTIYNQARYYPARFLSFSAQIIQGHAVGRIAVHPILYNPVTKTMRHLRYLRFEIKKSLTGNAPLSKGKFSKQFDASFRGKTFTRPTVESLRQGKSVFAAPGEDFVKLYNVEDGVYAVSGSQLQDLGVDISRIDPSTLHIFNKGIEGACTVAGAEDGVFNAADKIIYYAERLAGENGFYDSYTDSNVTILTWGNSQGRRYHSTPSSVAGSTQISTVMTTLHLERDVEYYFGDTDADIHETSAVPGEGWVWTKSIFPGSIVRVPFDLPALQSDEDSVQVRVRLRGITFAPQTPDHHARFVINGTTLKDIFFNDTEEKIVHFSAPLSLLQENGNQLEIHSINDTGADRSKFYFDWVEFDYVKKLTARDGWLEFEAKSDTFYTTGFSSDTVNVWNVTAQKQMQPLSVDKRRNAMLQVKSAGYSDGNYAQFLIDDQYIFLGKRGINLLVLNPQTGAVLDQVTFDTYASKEMADSLAAYINRLADSTIVLAAVRDEASVNMTATAFDALESLGSSLIRQLGARDSWALMGRKGAAKGTVPEMLKISGQGAAELSQMMTFSQGSSSYTVIFSDSSESKNKYLLFDNAGLKKPARLVLAHSADLSRTDNGADYIIITHPIFLEQAKRLADYRQQHNHFRTKVVSVDDIYNEFNNGIADPNAIHRFLQYAYQNWAAPAPSYLLLFGDASWDPKRNIKNADKIDYVPTLGNPVTDILFACFDGPDDILPEMKVGRLPVENISQAKAIVDKIITYETTPSAAWKKNLVFINGGFNVIEQNTFVQQSQTLVREFVSPPPMGGNALLINKHGQGYEEGEHRQDILDAFDAGTVWVNFIGHAGSRTWDLMFHNPDIEDLQNGPMNPFISSMTCHTGRFAEPNQTSFGENFLLLPENGAIGFWGTSGWGYSYEDYIYLRNLFPIVLEDTVHTLGDAITLTKLALWKTFGSIPHIRDLILQYNLLGDPALTLAIPGKPDLNIQPSDVSTDPLILNEADSIATIKVQVHNFGLVPRDSVQVSLYADHQVSGKMQIEGIKTIPPVAFVDSLAFTWPLRNMSGEVQLEAAVDPNNLIPEVDETNNEQKLKVSVLSNLIHIESPPQQAMIAAKNAILKIQNPQQKEWADLQYEFQIDTSDAFTSPTLLSSGPVSAQKLITTWSPGALIPGQVYFWRCNSYPPTAHSAWVTGSFYTLADNEYGWRQNHKVHFASNISENTMPADNGIQLQKNSISLYVESAGISDGNFARIIVNSKAYIQPKRGHNVVILDRTSGKVEQARTFDTYLDSLQADAMAAFIDSVSAEKYILIAIKDEGSRSMTERAYRALESIGSKECRSVGYRDSWALIGHKGAIQGSVPEAFVRTGSGTATVADTLLLYHSAGKNVTPKIGATRHWKKLRWDAAVPQLCDFSINVLGYNVSGKIDTLLKDLRDGSGIDLSNIRADIYPYISLLARFSTQNGNYTPLLNWWQVSFDPVPDLAIGPQTVSQQQDSVLVGESVNFRFDIYNIGDASAESLKVQFEESDVAAGRKIFAQQKLNMATIAPDSFYTVTQTWASDGKRGLQKIYITLDPDNQIPELSESNNALTAGVYVKTDTSAPKIEITFDGKEIIYNDLVASKPHILAKIMDNSPAPITDTSLVKVVLDGERQSFLNASGALRIQQADENSQRGLVEFNPVLKDGDHLLEFFVSDASGNLIYDRVDFRVVSELKLNHVVNFPNPFARATDFTFELTQPAQVDIKVYTVAGRLIRSFDAGWCNAGFNKFHWDGRDADGDRLANGVYLYKIFAKGEKKKVEETSKAIVMR